MELISEGILWKYLKMKIFTAPLGHPVQNIFFASIKKIFVHCKKCRGDLLSFTNIYLRVKQIYGRVQNKGLLKILRMFHYIYLFY